MAQLRSVRRSAMATMPKALLKHPAFSHPSEYVSVPVDKVFLLKVHVDRWPGLFHKSPIHIDTFRQDFFPNYNLRWTMPPNLRLEERAEPRLSHKTTNTGKRYCYTGMEGQSLC